MAEIEKFSPPRSFKLSLITPERSVLEADATFVALPAHDGEMGVLANRAPLLVRLGVGWLRAVIAEGRRSFLIDGGFAQMVDNRLSVLTEHAQAAEKVDREASQQLLEEAEAMNAPDQAAFEQRQRALARARAGLRGPGGLPRSGV